MPGEQPTPLWRKLGIHEGAVVALCGAPGGFEIPSLPRGATLRRTARGRADLTVWFVRDRHELARKMDSMAPRAEASALWIAWPKRSSPLSGELTDEVVRGAGLRAGLVDFKVCSIDADWSGLRFNRRREPSRVPE